MIPDHAARQTALDISQSFIVQAPAGSGKTELLVQRFLALLACAEHSPEEIIAITFTRKAAAEMRQRILEALHLAKQPAPDEPHKRKTWELGCAALQRDQVSGWHLLENSHRLRVQTIDALCRSIAHRAPLLSGLGISDQLLEKEIATYYLTAARHLLQTLEEESPLSTHLASLLSHLDNRIDVVEGLLVRMLACREQWLPHLFSHNKYITQSELRRILEKNLSDAVSDVLLHCDKALPDTERHEIVKMMRFSAENLSIDDPIASTVQRLKDVPEATPENYSQWLFLAHLLLTKEGTWRLKVDKRNGFPADEKSIKQSMMVLLKRLHEHETFRRSLADLLEAPPLHYTISQWKILAALFGLLPTLVTELKVLFKTNNVSDFSEVSMAADLALGSEEDPTDLTLLLDAQIHHLLIDEFQDTSIAQFRLLEKLTAGWEPHDGRSLFLVGDPMQSIYRFRQAEVGLFLKAQQEGLGGVPLKPLFLSSNFRATPKLVEWINHQFSSIFPTQSDISLGAVTFSHCIATKTSDEHSAVVIDLFSYTEEYKKTAHIIHIILQEQSQHPENTIAILVRSRSHLKEIIPAIKQARIPFFAVDIDPLYEQSIVQDLLSLTGALLHLGDRLSWLSTLRAPWVGLTLHDLHAISQQGKKILWEALSDISPIQPLSEDGQKRLAAIMPIFKTALTQRGRLPLRTWIEETWFALNGPACAIDDIALRSAESYFELLSTFDQIGELPDINTLKQAVQKQYATPTAPVAARLHIMTIHKAKGLEFDTVILPYLESKNRGDDEQLLLWLDRPRAQGTDSLILAPIKSRKEKSDPIYDWLRNIEKKKAQHELTRLVYVATTRAKKKLHLMAMCAVEKEKALIKKPSTGTFLDLLWESSEKSRQHFLEKIHPTKEPIHSEVSTRPTRSLQRLKIDFYSHHTAPIVPATPTHTPSELTSLTPTDAISTAIGTVVHAVLEQVSHEGLNIWTAQKIEQEKPRWRMWLLQRGISQQVLSDSICKIQSAVQNALDDPRGRWILTPHREHKSEYALTALMDGTPLHCIIDRTFVDAHQLRWIIDYKTGKPLPHQTTADFLAAAQALYREQLENYAKIMQQQDHHPIRLGLYFPAFKGWCEWMLE